jgi:hypothetical protein
MSAISPPEARVRGLFGIRVVGQTRRRLRAQARDLCRSRRGYAENIAALCAVDRFAARLRGPRARGLEGLACGPQAIGEPKPEARRGREHAGTVGQLVGVEPERQRALAEHH